MGRVPDHHGKSSGIQEGEQGQIEPDEKSLCGKHIHPGRTINYLRLLRKYILLEINMMQIMVPWDVKTTNYYDESIAKRQKSMPNMNLGTAWNSSHCPRHSAMPSPKPFPPASRPPTSPPAQDHDDHLPSPPLPKTPSTSTTTTSRVSERRAPLQSSTMVRRTAPVQPLVLVHKKQPQQTSTNLSPGTPKDIPWSPMPQLSPAESDLLWMLPTLPETPTNYPRRKSIGEVPGESQAKGSKKKAKTRRRLRELIASSKESLRQLWHRGDEDPWQSVKYDSP